MVEYVVLALIAGVAMVLVAVRRSGSRRRTTASTGRSVLGVRDSYGFPVREADAVDTVPAAAWPLRRVDGEAPAWQRLDGEDRTAAR